MQRGWNCKANHLAQKGAANLYHASLADILDAQSSLIIRTSIFVALVLRNFTHCLQVKQTLKVKQQSSTQKFHRSEVTLALL